MSAASLLDLRTEERAGVSSRAAAARLRVARGERGGCAAVLELRLRTSEYAKTPPMHTVQPSIFIISRLSPGEG